MDFVSFRVNGAITTKARPRARVVAGKYASVYTPQSTILYENLIKVSYQDQHNVYYGEMPVAVEIEAYFAPNQEVKKYKESGLNVACKVNKDLDNIAKTILDALNGIAYKDDKQVVDLEVRKYYSNKDNDYQEYIEVRIRPIQETTIKQAKAIYQKEREIKRLEAKIDKLRSLPRLTPKKAQELNETIEKLNELKYVF